MAWGLGYFGMPHILLRFMAIEDENKLAMSRRVASVWVVIAMFIAIAIGIVGKTMTGAGLVKNLTDANTETIIIQIANTIAEHGAVMAIGAGLVLAGILASTMSTADSQLLAAASSVSQDMSWQVFWPAPCPRLTPSCWRQHPASARILCREPCGPIRIKRP